MKRNKLTRRQMLRLSAIAGTGAVIAACGGAAPTAAPAAPTAAPAATEAPAAATAAPAATEAPKATDAPAATAAPAATEAPKAAAAPAGDVPRNQTLIAVHGLDQIDVANPWSTGYTHQGGNAMMWEPLFFFAIFADKELPWLAESGEYNKDFTQLTIKVRKEAAWSDGKPVTADDVIWTFDNQMKNEKLNYHGQFNEFVKDYSKTDDQTVVVNFKQPAPRFKFEVLSLKFDTGIPLVPKHSFEGQADVNAFKGGADMAHSGAYKITSWTKDQKFLDVRADWWAAKAGVNPVPAVKRFIFLNFSTPENAAQRVVNNDADWCLDLRNAAIKSVIDQNPKVTTWTGKDAPHGYLDWWPNSLWMNTQVAPYTDPTIRKAVSLAIERDKVNEVVYEGAKIATIYPFPLYPALQKFADSDAVKKLEQQYEPGKFDLDASGKLLEAAGYKKNADGLYEKDGKTIPGPIFGFAGIHSDIVPVLVEMLKNGGIDASDHTADTDAYQSMADGKPGFYMFGHGASLKDPYAALELFHSKYSAQIGTTAGNNRFSRYKNPDYDKIVDAMAPLASDDPKFQDLAAQALGIYWKDTIDVPVIQWLHRIPYNQTYWTNFPLASNLANGTNGAYWAHTGHLVVTNLKAVG